MVCIDCYIQIRHAMCCKKKRMIHMDTAQSKARSGMSAYYCVFCNYHHIGHNIKKPVKPLAYIDQLLRFDFLSDCPLCFKIKEK